VARVRHAQQPDIGQHLQLELQSTVLAWSAISGLGRRTIGTGFEARVAKSVNAALSDQDLQAILGDIGDQLLGIGIHHTRAYRHAHDQIFATTASTSLPHPTLAGLGTVLGLKAKIHEGIEAAITKQIDAAAIATIATIGTPPGNIFFSTKTETAVATATCFNSNYCLIYKFHYRANQIK